MTEAITDAIWSVANAASETGDPRAVEALTALLQPAPRGSAAWTEAMAERPALLAAIAERHAGECQNLRQFTDAVCAVGDRYQRQRWRCDRRAVQPPCDLIDDERDAFTILRTLGAFPRNTTIRDEISDWFDEFILFNPKTGRSRGKE